MASVTPHTGKISDLAVDDWHVEVSSHEYPRLRVEVVQDMPESGLVKHDILICRGKCDVLNSKSRI